jgi:RNA polymerase sigma-70 factor (family 1)
MPFNTYNEKELFLQIAAGDELAFKEIFNRYKIRLYSVAFKITRSEILAEEVVQEILMTIWLKRSLLPNIEKPSAYLFTMVYNSSYLHFKNRAVEESFKTKAIGRMMESCNETQELLDARESQNIIARAANQLPSQQQLIYNLNKEQGLNRQEIAERLGISPNTVRNHLHEALKSIRIYFQEAVGLFILFFSVYR